MTRSLVPVRFFDTASALGGSLALKGLLSAPSLGRAARAEAALAVCPHATAGSASSLASGRGCRPAEKAKAMSTRSQPRTRMRRNSPNSSPQKAFLDPLADSLAHGVTRMARGAPVDGRAPSRGVPGDVRRRVHGPQLVHEVFGVIALSSDRPLRGSASSAGASPARLHRDHAATAHPRPGPATRSMSVLQSNQHPTSSYFMT